MRRRQTKRAQGKRRRLPLKRRLISERRLDRMVEEATVDAYGESEQAVAFLTVLQDELKLPFQTEVLGVTVTVERIDANGVGDIVAYSRSGRHHQAIALVDLPLPRPRPKG